MGIMLFLGKWLAPSLTTKKRRKTMKEVKEVLERLMTAFFQEDLSLRSESLEVATTKLEDVWSYCAFKGDLDTLEFLNSRLLHMIGRCNAMVGEVADDLQCRYLIIWETICNLTQALVQRAPGREELAELRKGFGVGENLLIQIECWETISELSAALGISEQDCHNALNRLKEAGFVSSVPGRYGYALTGRGFATITEAKRRG